MAVFCGRLPRSLLFSALTAALVVAPEARDPRLAPHRPIPQERPLTEAQREQAKRLVDLVDQAMAGKPPTSDFSVLWYNAFLRARDGKTYVPYTVALAADATALDLAVYVRVASPGAKEFAFEDLLFVRLKPDESQRLIQRAFLVSPGTYTVYVALTESEMPKSAERTGGHSAVHQQTIVVPDYASKELAISSVILADSARQLDAPLTPEQQLERPYIIGRSEVTPSVDVEFMPTDTLTVLFLIYNPQPDDGKKPHVEVEYNFYRKTAGGKTFFNKTPPQVFSAATLPREFDVTAGHLIVARQVLKLTPFPAGDYRLEITVNDKLSGKSLEREVWFSVAGS